MENVIGIIGGSGLYDFLPGEELTVTTPYGQPSDRLLISTYKNRKIVFLPRHGKIHQLPPHKINYRANIYALKELGVTHILAPCAVGSLKPDLKPGDFVVCDQLIDRTKSRVDTFFDGPKIAHISMAEPYCPELRGVVISSCANLSLPCHTTGTVVIVEGPRFSTKAESRMYAQIADVINMTQYPEVVLAREKEICYTNISLITDFDAGVPGREDITAVTARSYAEVFKASLVNVKQVLFDVIEHIPEQSHCNCAHALEDAIS
ncbi:MAG: S-methyl-5'-thioadenosine phosphorylase [Patescibacteria group bacterium]|jgi:5'-methylthioadenosine phosphorylase